MKKFLALILALTMVMGMATMAMAADAGNATLTDADKDTEISVDVTIKDSSVTAAKVYNVEVIWSSMNFEYDFGTTAPTWQPDSHSYTVGTDAKWTNDTAYIHVVNHSNDQVTINMTFKNANAVTSTTDGVTAELTNYTKTLESAEGHAKVDETADGTAAHDAVITLVTTVKVSDVPDTDTGFTVDTIVVSFTHN